MPSRRQIANKNSDGLKKKFSGPVSSLSCRMMFFKASLATSVCTVESLIASFMGPTWGPPGADRTQVGPMLAPWSLLSGVCHRSCFDLLCWVFRDSFALFTHVLQGCFVSSGAVEYAAQQSLLGLHTILTPCHVVTQVWVGCDRIYWISGPSSL